MVNKINIKQILKAAAVVGLFSLGLRLVTKKKQTVKTVVAEIVETPEKVVKEATKIIKKVVPKKSSKKKSTGKKVKKKRAPSKRFPKGSQAAKDHMNKLRAMQKKNKK